ncbi:MAG: D-isomer specific 2-hydroxyacid dehydrogenase family protein [Aerococcus sp.]|nr:D-isomer specific 2-hydroxyacid dehydrogenase family protein [Aerococcus sp.]
MSNYKIAIVNSSSFGNKFREHYEALKKIGDVERVNVDPQIGGEELANALAGFNIIIASVAPYYNKEFFENKDELILISRHGIGYNNIDLEAAKEYGTLVSIVDAVVERESVAENNVTNLLSLMRENIGSSEAVKKGEWKNRAHYIGKSLFHKTVGIIGVGSIGSKVAEILKYGFNCKILGYDPYKNEKFMSEFGVGKVELKELLANSDAICICASLNDNNHHMISQDEVSYMKKGMYISNTARGELVSEDAILEGIANDIISGYATDVLEDEPIANDHPFLTNKDIIVTPHTSAYTEECIKQMGNKCVDDVQKVVEHQLPSRTIQEYSQYI